MSDPILTPTFRRLDEYAGHWLMEPVAFSALWHATRAVDLAAHMAEGPPEPLRSQLEITSVREQKVGIISIVGTLMKQRSSMGGTSTVQLRRDVREAARNADVSAILLAIDSPGGIVAGTSDLAAEIQSARRQKPVWAYVEDLGASAAYWIASQSEAIYANAPTALVGSIGTVLTVYDYSAAAEQEGVRAMVFATGPLKGAGTPGTAVTPEQQTYFQSIVDGVQSEFDAAVRKGRGLTAAQLAAVKTGGVWKASQAKELGLIDGIQSLPQTLDALAKSVGQPTQKKRTSAVLPMLGSV